MYSHQGEKIAEDIIALHTLCHKHGVATICIEGSSLNSVEGSNLWSILRFNISTARGFCMLPSYITVLPCQYHPTTALQMRSTTVRYA